MTPRDVDDLAPAEVDAMSRYMRAELKARKDAARRAGRKR